MKRVFRAASLIQVAHARNVLLTAGIESELRNQYLAGALGDLPMLETWPQLYVETRTKQSHCVRWPAPRSRRPAHPGPAKSAASSSNRSSPAAGAVDQLHRKCLRRLLAPAPRAA